MEELIQAVDYKPAKQEEFDPHANLKSEYQELKEFLGYIYADNDKAFLSVNKVFFERPASSLDTLNLARILYDDKNYQQCAQVLKLYCVKQSQSGPVQNQPEE